MWPRAAGASARTGPDRGCRNRTVTSQPQPAETAAVAAVFGFSGGGSGLRGWAENVVRLHSWLYSLNADHSCIGELVMGRIFIYSSHVRTAIVFSPRCSAPFTSQMHRKLPQTFDELFYNSTWCAVRKHCSAVSNCSMLPKSMSLHLCPCIPLIIYNCITCFSCALLAARHYCHHLCICPRLMRSNITL